MSDVNGPIARPMRSFGRVKGRRLKPSQARVLRDFAPAVGLDLDRPLDLAAMFQGRPAALEIGFGAGEHLVGQATSRPEWGVIGVEPFVNGFSACLRDVEEAGLANVRLHQGDARDVIARLPDGGLGRVWILFPDPWPKLRHHKRRLIQPAFISELSRILRPGGDVRFATDWRNYADWTLRAFLAAPDFEWAADAAADWRQPFAEHIETRYEAKRLGDCAPIFLRFVRV
ncbi:MAG: tRNA (guanosine(46)-N7)-methyltransferase TrmB [Caulobacterales bacterium]